MIVVTGGGGFLGSAIVYALNQRGRTDLLVVDRADHPEKQKNLASLKLERLASPEEFLQQVQDRSLSEVESIIHMGACSSTTETDRAYLAKNNFEYTRDLAAFAMEREVRFIYASSAATYGNGDQGYSDDESNLETLRPLNPYGESKQSFDLWAKANGALKTIVGLKYFNVYGPNEYHKGDMQSMVRKGFYQISETGAMRLFKSYRTQYGDGEQLRDFIYVKDAVAMTLFFLDHPEAGGIFNVGTGQPGNWNNLAQSIFAAMGREARIEYIDMPESIRDQYQYYTAAKIDKIRHAGYTPPTLSLEEGIRDYVQAYLIPGKRLGE